MNAFWILMATVATAGLATLSAQDAPSSEAPHELRLASALNAFAADLQGEIVKGANATCSPISVSAALLALAAGARGQTLEEIARTLHLPQDLRGDTLNTAAAKLFEVADLRACRESRSSGRSSSRFSGATM